MPKPVVHGWVFMEGGEGIPCGEVGDLPHSRHWVLVTCQGCLECKKRLDLAAAYRRQHVTKEDA